MAPLAKKIADLTPAQLQALADSLLARRPATDSSRIKPRQPRPQRVPLSYSQEALWALHQIEAVDATYNESLGMRLKGDLDVVALQWALSEIVRRHEVLRSRVATTDTGEPIQIFAAVAPVELDVETEMPGGGTVANWLTRQAARVFDLAKGPLFHAALLRLSPREHVLAWTVHHIVWDLWSLGNFMRELGTLYASRVSGRPGLLAEPEIQYADYALWQREERQVAALKEQLAYWKEQLSGAPADLPLPLDHPRPAEPTYAGERNTFLIPRETLVALKDLTRREGATLYITLLTAVQLLLSRWTGEKDIVVGSPVAGRSRKELERLIGFFVNTVVLRADLSGAPSFRELLARVRKTTLEAFARQDVPFEKVVAELRPGRRGARQNLFQVNVILQNQPLGSLALPGLEIEPVWPEDAFSKFDLTFEFFEAPQGLLLRLEHSTELFETATINRLIDSFGTLLAGIVENPDASIARLPVLAKAELEKVLLHGKASAIDFPRDKCVHQIFSDVAARYPDRVAIECGGRTVTYRELDERSNAVAAALAVKGVGLESKVGLYFERSIELIVGIIGILKAGGIYVPLDPANPAARLAYLIQDAGISTAIAQPNLVDEFRTDHVDTECVTLEDLESAGRDATAPCLARSAHQLACVLYTSGSTGKPKGVATPHIAINRLVQNSTWVDWSNIRSVLCMASIGFDASTLEIWGALLNGARMVVIAERLPCLDHIATLTAGQTIDLAWITASLFNNTVDTDVQSLANIRRIFTGGEALSVRHVTAAQRALPDLRLFNGYGPTESTVFATTHAIPRSLPSTAARVPIGRAISNTRLLVLDEQMQHVPTGVVGELYVGGEGLARGYLNKPRLTAERFVADPFSASGERLYRTGDLVRFLADGTIDFVGRADHQVKLRGFRIELGEIESQVLALPEVRQTLVMVREDSPGLRRIVAYLVTSDGQPLDVAMIREQLRQSLPDYMIPAAFVFLPSMPLNRSGKIDRAALPVPDVQPSAATEYVAPSNDIEATLAHIWEDTLKIPRVGVHDNFFEIGGDSIVAMQIVSKATRAGLKLTPRSLFERQTVATLAQVAGAVTAGGRAQAPASGTLPLIPVQRWFFEQDFKAPQHFNQTVVLSLSRRLDPMLIQKALGYLVQHHDSLRLRYTRTDAGWTQCYADLSDPAEAVPLEQIDLSHIARDARTQVLAERGAVLQASLNLTDGPIVRAALFDFGETQHQRLLFAVHHLVVDGVSWRVLLEDLQLAYEQLERGEEVRLPGKTDSFKAWADRLEASASDETFRGSADFWRRHASTEVSPLPNQREGRNTVGAAREITVRLTTEETKQLLHEVPAAYGSQINDVLLTAVHDAFREWTGSGKLWITLEGHGREDVFDGIDISRTVGWFTSLFPVVFEADGASSAADKIATIGSTLRALPQRGLAYGVLRYLAKDPVLAEMPSPNVSFNYLGQFDHGADEKPLFCMAPEHGGPVRDERDSRGHLIDIEGGIFGGRLTMSWRYGSEIHDAATITKLAESFIASLRNIIQLAPSVRSTVPLTPIQRHAIEWLKEDFRKNILVQVLKPGMWIRADILEQALAELVRQHDSLRLGVRNGNAGLEQWKAGLTAAASPALLQRIRSTCRSTEQADIDNEIGEIILKLRGSVDVFAPPILRAALVELPQQDSQRLILAIHHLGIDPVSAGMVLQDLQLLYEQLERGERPSLPERTSPFSTWAWRLEAYSKSDEIRREARYWQGLPWQRIRHLPTDSPFDDSHIRSETVCLNSAETDALLTKLPRQLKAQTDELLVAALSLTLAKWSRADALCIDYMHHGRFTAFPEINLAKTVGWFSTEIPLFIEVDRSLSVSAALPSIASQFNTSIEHGLSHGTLTRMCETNPLANLPRADIRLNYLGRGDTKRAGPVTTPVFEPQLTAFSHEASLKLDHPIELQVFVRQDALCMKWIHDERTYRAGTIQKLAGDLARALRTVLEEHK